MRLINSAEIAIVSGGTSNWVQVDGQDDCIGGVDDIGGVGGGISMGFAEKKGNSATATEKTGEVTCPSGTVPKITVKTNNTVTSGGGDLFLNLTKIGGGVGGNGSTSTTTTETTVTCEKLGRK